MKLYSVLLTAILPLFTWSSSPASTIALLETSQTISNTTTVDQTFNFFSTLPASGLTGLHDETAVASFSLFDDNSGSVSITINQWHGLINPLQGPPLFDLTLLLGDSFSCSGIIACSSDTVTSSTAGQQHSESDHLGQAVDSIGIHLNFTLSPGDSVAFNSRWEISPVPLPAAFWLFFSGLMIFAGVVRKEK